MNIPNTSLFQPKQDFQIKKLEDPSIQPFILHFRDGNPLMKRKLQSPDQCILFRHLGSLVLRDRVLYRKRTVDGNDQFQLIVPTSLGKTALAGVHDDVTNLGCIRSLQLDI